MTAGTPAARGAPALRMYALLVAASAACLGPQTSDRSGYSANLLPEDAKVPALANDKQLTQKVASNAGVSGKVALRTGFARGGIVHYWDFGSAPGTAKPVWIFRRKSHGQLEDFGHPPLVDSLPGDTSYTVLRSLFLVVVTGAYSGERITSSKALDDALELGLIETPKPLDQFVDWPIVPPGTTLDLGLGSPPLTASPIYCAGVVASFFPLGEMAERMGIGAIPKGPMGPLPIPTPDALLLRRQDEPQPLDEALQHQDLNGDTDQADTNTVFTVGPDEPSYSGLVREIDVVVPADYVFGDARAEEDLFMKQAGGRVARSGRVVEYAPSMLLLNRPIYAWPAESDGGTAP